MLNIRKSIFETNSSSMHSIIISNNKDFEKDDYFMNNWNEYPVLEFEEDEMYWGRSPLEFLDTFEEKINYLISSEVHNEEDFNEVVKAVNEVLHENGINIEATIKLPQTEKYDYKKHKYTGELVPYYGDVDHQSCGTLRGFLNNYHLTYKEFLENPKIIVVIDGDEYCYFYDMIHTGIIDDKSIEVYPSADENDY